MGNSHAFNLSVCRTFAHYLHARPTRLCTRMHIISSDVWVQNIVMGVCVCVNAANVLTFMYSNTATRTRERMVGLVVVGTCFVAFTP